MSEQAFLPKRVAIEKIVRHLERKWSTLRFELQDNKRSLAKLHKEGAALVAERKALFSLSQALKRGLDKGTNPIPCRSCGMIEVHGPNCKVKRRPDGE